MSEYTRQCPCGYSWEVEAGDPCPKCGAVYACYVCGELISRVGGVAVMHNVTDKRGTWLAGFCLDCAVEHDEQAAQFEPIIKPGERAPETVTYEVNLCPSCLGMGVDMVALARPAKPCPQCGGMGVVRARDLTALQEPTKAAQEGPGVSLIDDVEAFLRRSQGGTHE